MTLLTVLPRLRTDNLKGLGATLTHHADEPAVRNFVQTFDHHHDVFIVRRLGEMPDDIIKSDDTDYVMGRIRAGYIKDSTVTIVMGGQCTWARRYVDREVQASLRAGDTATPNGLLGIKLPTFTRFPDRFDLNLKQAGDADSFAGWIDYPQTIEDLDRYWAFDRRKTYQKTYS
ncbi:TIR domain-containing protein [Bradyrhizobium brasilense]|uniref:TIR domain-containing protein n=1 Tax=Bradyrhizobium brasilense TaxID=1419277 RepID=UPI001E57F1D6|nr:TIR domain-containing protein [Bradyrhizobium brasilense]